MKLLPRPITAALLSLPLALTAASECDELRNLKLPQARIHSSVRVAEGDRLALWAGGQPQAMPKGFCRVRGTASPVVGSSIGFEVWLPEKAAWNGKYLQAGNGGTAGSVPLSSLLDGVVRGYATAATDSGHLWPDGLDYGWANGRPESVVDFGWRAVQRTNEAAKRIVTASQGTAPKKSYFVGCSDGGRDAMMAAQRMPRAFDGIVAGAPAINWIDLMTASALVQREFTLPVTALPTAKLPAIQAAALAACGNGKPYVANPQSCSFDPAVMACRDADTNACLTPKQVELVRQIYRGMPNPETGRLLPGLIPGAEADPGNWDFWILRAPTNPLGGNSASTTQPTSIGESFFRHLVREDSSFILADLKTADMAEGRRRWSADLDATDPDLRAFKRRGGKLLHYHGWADSAIPPSMSIDYFKAVQARMGNTDSFYRLFMVPGMNHCAGGNGPWQTDWLETLERWVEAGESPDAITTRHPGRNDTQTLRSQSKN